MDLFQTTIKNLEKYHLNESRDWNKCLVVASHYSLNLVYTAPEGKTIKNLFFPSPLS